MIQPHSVSERQQSTPVQQRMPLILLAATKAATLAIWEELLAPVGYMTIACQSTWAAQQSIDTDHPDLLLVERDLDWYGAGWDLLAIVRRHQKLGALPVILYTPDRRWLRMQQRQLQAWGCRILPHPFSTAELWSMVATALESPVLLSREVEL
jgi:CheY-like chemotaxis protein